MTLFLLYCRYWHLVSVLHPSPICQYLHLVLQTPQARESLSPHSDLLLKRWESYNQTYQASLLPGAVQCWEGGAPPIPLKGQEAAYDYFDDASLLKQTAHENVSCHRLLPDYDMSASWRKPGIPCCTGSTFCLPPRPGGGPICSISPVC